MKIKPYTHLHDYTIISTCYIYIYVYIYIKKERESALAETSIKLLVVLEGIITVSFALLSEFFSADYLLQVRH